MSQPIKSTLTDGPIGKTLVRLTIPMIIGIFSIVGFNLVDAYFIGQLGALPLAALSFTFPVVMVMGSIGMGLGIGAAAVISKAIGEEHQEKIKRLTTDSILLALLFGFVFVFLGLLTIDPLFRLLGATDEVMPAITSYMYIWYIGVVFVLVPMVGSAAIRSNGDTKTPAAIMFSMVVMNFILDPILIFGWGPIPALGLKGAAIATVLARSVTLILGIYVLHFREGMLTFALPTTSQLVASFKSILFVGLPAAATNLVVPLTTAVITNLVATYGTEAVAALGVASRIDVLAITVVIALGSALGPFIGQNLGAKKMGRLSKGFMLSVQFAMIWGITLALLIYVFSNQIAPIFSNNNKVASIIILYLSIAPIGYAFRGVYAISNTSLNVLGKPMHAALITVVQMFVVYIPLAYLGASKFGLVGVFGAYAIAYIFGGGVGYFFVKKNIGRADLDGPEQRDENILDSDMV